MELLIVFILCALALFLSRWIPHPQPSQLTLAQIIFVVAGLLVGAGLSSGAMAAVIGGLVGLLICDFIFIAARSPR